MSGDWSDELTCTMYTNLSTDIDVVTSTDSTQPYRSICVDNNAFVSTTSHSYYESVSYHPPDYTELIKKLIKKERIEKMKKSWTKNVRDLVVKPMKPLGLRGVPLDGRGWA